MVSKAESEAQEDRGVKWISGKNFFRQGGTCYGKLMYQIRSL